MLEAELFSLLEPTPDATYVATDRGTICFWNRAAELLFGYAASEVLGRDVDEVLDGRDALGTRVLAGGPEASVRRSDRSPGGIPNFDLEARTRSGRRIWVGVSTIVFDNPRARRRLFIRLMHDIDQRRRNEDLLKHMLEAARQLIALAGESAHHARVEPLSEQERRILKLLADGGNSATIARGLRISTQTLRNHLHNINCKLRTHNRLEAVSHAQRRGLIDRPVYANGRQSGSV